MCVIVVFLDSATSLRNLNEERASLKRMLSNDGMILVLPGSLWLFYRAGVRQSSPTKPIAEPGFLSYPVFSMKSEIPGQSWSTWLDRKSAWFTDLVGLGWYKVKLVLLFHVNTKSVIYKYY